MYMNTLKNILYKYSKCNSMIMINNKNKMKDTEVMKSVVYI